LEHQLLLMCSPLQSEDDAERQLPAARVLERPGNGASVLFQADAEDESAAGP
jgi:hypothetical protein